MTSKEKQILISKENQLHDSLVSAECVVLSNVYFDNDFQQVDYNKYHDILLKDTNYLTALYEWSAVHELCVTFKIDTSTPQRRQASCKYLDTLHEYTIL